MFNSYYKKLLSLILIASLSQVLAGVPVVAAQSISDKEAARVAKVKASILKLGTGSDAKIKVKLRDDTKLSGYVVQANADSFVMADSKTGTSTEIPYPNVTQARGKNLSTGAIVAISAGVAVGVTLLTIYLLAMALAD